jgi:hypothetical protein
LQAGIVALFFFDLDQGHRMAGGYLPATRALDYDVGASGSLAGSMMAALIQVNWAIQALVQTE